MIPVEITVFEDRSFTFITKSPPAAVLIKQAPQPRQGLGRAQPREGRARSPRLSSSRSRSARWRTSTRTTSSRRRRSSRARPARWAWTWSTDAQHGKAYRDALDKIDREHVYGPAAAIALLKEAAANKFDESVELHVRTGLNVRHADEQLRGTIALPHGLGKE